MRTSRAPLLLLPLLATLLLPQTPLHAEGDLEAWERNFSLRFSATEPGTIRLIGNANLTCDETFTPDTCEDARQGEAAGSANNNNQHWMRMVDVDGDETTFNSSSADLVYRGLGLTHEGNDEGDVPAPGEGGIAAPGPDAPQVLWAGLYWGADTNRRALSGREGEIAPDQDALNEVLLRAPGDDAFRTITADECSQRSETAAERDYICFADITALLPEDPGGTWTLANLQTGQGGNRYAGWSIVFVLQDPAEPTRNLSVFDGVRRISTDNEATLGISGFLTPPFGPVRTQLGVVAWEGDRAQIGSRFVLEGTELSDPLRPQNNFLNTSITSFGEAVTTRNPSWPNTMGIDIGLLETVDILPNDAEEAEIELRTTAGTYFAGVVTFATEIFAPQPRVLKTVTNLSGGDARPDDRLRYTLTLSNEGFDPAGNLVLLDTLHEALTLDPDSVRLDGSEDATFSFDDETRTLSIPLPDLLPETTQTLTFEVILGDNVTPGQQISNQAALDYRAPTLERDLRRLSSADPDTPGVATVFRVSDTPPELRIDTPQDNAFLATLRPTISGETSPGATVTLRLRNEGTELVETPEVNGEGRWSWTADTDLAEDVWTLDAAAEDRIGNRAELPQRTFILDVTPPALVIDAPEAGALLFTQRPQIRGTGEPTAAVRLRVEDEASEEIWSTEFELPRSGNWEVIPDALGEGERRLFATARDAAGNTTNLDPLPFTIDTRPPSLDWTTPADGATTAEERPLIAGTTDADATLTLRLSPEGQPSLPDVAIAVDPTSGVFSWEPQDTLTERTWTLRLEAERPNGRTTTETRTLIIDRSEPTDPEPSEPGSEPSEPEPSEPGSEPSEPEPSEPGSEPSEPEPSDDPGTQDPEPSTTPEPGPGSDTPGASDDPTGDASEETESAPPAPSDAPTEGEESSDRSQSGAESGCGGCAAASSSGAPSAPWPLAGLLLLLATRRRG